MCLQDMNDHVSQEFRVFSCGQQYFFINSHFVACFSSYIYISLLLLPLCTLSIKFSELSFLIMHPNNLNAVFIIVVSILLRTSLFVAYSIHGIHNIVGRPTIPFPIIHFFRVEIITHFSIHLLIFKFIPIRSYITHFLKYIFRYTYASNCIALTIVYYNTAQITEFCTFIILDVPNM